MTAAPGATELPAAFGNGRYAVKRLLGKGGQKVVYLVHDTLLDRPCALSLLECETLDQNEANRIRREGQALARMGAQPNIVTVHDMGEQDGRPFIVSEYIEGGDLAGELARAQGPLALDRAVRITRDVLKALAAVHSRGLVHRDVKPSNIWLDADGNAKLGDFGLALMSERSRITGAGEVTGTPAYIAPEQLDNRPLDGRADLYALGCVLFELLAGRPPFSGTMISVISQHLHAAPSAPSRLNPGVSPEFDRLVLDLLAKVPDERPPSAQDVLKRLGAIAGFSEPHLEKAQASSAPAAGTMIPAQPVSPVATTFVHQKPVRKVGVPTLAVLAAVAVAAAAVALFASRSSVANTRRLAIIATREPTATVNATLAWALSSRIVEEIDRYAEFRPVSTAGVLAARLSVLGSAVAVPDEMAAADIARRLDAETVASLSASTGPGGELTVAFHVFAVSDPTLGVASGRDRLLAKDLDRGAPARLAEVLLNTLRRHWRMPALTDEAKGAKARDVSFEAYQLFVQGMQYCLSGQYEQCELLARRGLDIDPDDAMTHAQLGCALSFQGKDDAAVKEVERAHALRDQLLSRHHREIVDNDWMFVLAEKAKSAGDEAKARELGQKLVALDDDMVKSYDDPMGYLYGAVAAQWLVGDTAAARQRYAEARRVSPLLYPPYHEEAKLLRGDGKNAEGNDKAAHLLWTYVRCQSRSEMAAVARRTAAEWGLAEPKDVVCPL